MMTGVHALLLALVTASPLPSPSPSVSPSPAATASPVPRPLLVTPKHWTKAPVESKTSDGTRFDADYLRFTGRTVQEINVIEGRNVGLSTAEYVKINIPAAARDMHITVLESRAFPICDGQAGWLVRYHKPQAGRQLTITQVFGVNDQHAYIATYGRPIDQKDDPDAIAALHTLCPPQAAHLAADTNAVPIQAPEGWRRLSTSVLTSSPDFVALWMGDAPGGFPQSVNVLRSPTMGTMPMADQAPLVVDELKKKYPDMVLRQSHAEKLCDKLDGWYFEYAMQMQGHDVIIEQTTVLDGNTMYIASYGRANGVPENPAARKSIDSLCPQDAAVAS